MSAFTFIGAADAFVDILDDTGVSTGLMLQGNCTEFTPKPDSERKEITSNGRETWGQVLDGGSVILPKPMTATVKFNSFELALFAAAFFGSSSTLTQTSGSLSAVNVTMRRDKWVETGKLMFTGSPALTHTSGSPTYVLNTDYEVNTRLGMLKAKTGGAITDLQVCKLTQSYAAVAGQVMEAMTKSNVRIRVKLDGKNYADGRNFIADIRQMRLQPTGDFSLIGQEFVEVGFEGVLEVPAGASGPLSVQWLS